jgi:hypothetical protein
MPKNSHGIAALFIEPNKIYAMNIRTCGRRSG